ncbi:hypothetical protein GCM10023205_04960 [Yinghuangia aomiensis]|uniref:Transposase n=1 Tax=Yinghuangia aomiensis TaxID=676205 RepID=A0ABP9GM86_9ACTN
MQYKPQLYTHPTRDKHLLMRWKGRFRCLSMSRMHQLQVVLRHLDRVAHVGWLIATDEAQVVHPRDSPLEPWPAPGHVNAAMFLHTARRPAAPERTGT